MCIRENVSHKSFSGFQCRHVMQHKCLFWKPINELNLLYNRPSFSSIWFFKILVLCLLLSLFLSLSHLLDPFFCWKKCSCLFNVLLINRINDRRRSYQGKKLIRRMRRLKIASRKHFLNEITQIR